MNHSPAAIPVECSCDEAVHRLTRALTGSGLRVLETFDLHDARLAFEDCPCPHHGTARCDCQMVVLMVYGEALAPTALTLHGNDAETWISLVNDTGERVEALVQAVIARALRTSDPQQGL